LLIGIDTGGTFTDLVALDAATGEISIVKVPSTPKQPADAPIAAIRQAEVAPDDVERIVMGTTIAINARLQKRGSTVLYIGTKGVEDTPIIARIDRKEAYNPAWRKPDSGIKRRHVFGIEERLDSKGGVLVALTPVELARLGDWVARWIQSDPRQDWAVAVNLLFSYVNAAHERAIGEYLAKRFPDVTVSLSHEVAPIWREYERSTTVITDAFIKRSIVEFSSRLATEIKSLGIDAQLSLMKSNGGHVEASTAAAVPVQLLLSGLAGGVIAGRHFACERQRQRGDARHGRHERRCRADRRGRVRIHDAVRGRVGCAGERAVHRLHHDWRRWRLDRLPRCRRPAARRAAERGRRTGARLLWAWWNRANRNRRECRAGTP
jgi:N-methylhydantoinase A